MTTVNDDLQAIRDRLVPKEPNDATVLEHLQSEAPTNSNPSEESAIAPTPPANRVVTFFLWLDSTYLSWMDTRSGQYIAYIFLAGLLAWSLATLLPSEQRTNQTLRQVYEYCKQE